MTIDSKNLGAIQAYQKLDKLHFQSIQQTLSNQVGDKSAQGVTSAQQSVQEMSKTDIRIERQASLVSHLFGDGQQTEQSSLKLTYQSAIEKLNEILMAQMPNYAPSVSEDGEQIQNPNMPGFKPISEEALQEQGGMEYWTPENTAKRIVEGATGFFSGFQNAHPELEGEALMNHFMEVVGGGLQQGFDEAKGILSDLKVLEGPIAENIASTFDLVQSGMQNFEKEFLASLVEPA